MTTKKEENKRMMEDIFTKRQIVKKAPITVEEYHEYKDKGHSDNKIMKHVGMHNASFNEWKHAAGLIGKAKEEKKKIRTLETTTTEEKQKAETRVAEELLPFEVTVETSNETEENVVYKTTDQSTIERLEKQLQHYKVERDHWFEMHRNTEKQLGVAAEETEEIKAENKTLREELDSSQFKYKNVLDERETLYVQVAKLEEMKKNQPYDLQSQQAYKSLKSEYESLKQEVETLRDAEQLSVALARRYVLLSEVVSS